MNTLDNGRTQNGKQVVPSKYFQFEHLRSLERRKSTWPPERGQGVQSKMPRTTARFAPQNVHGCHIIALLHCDLGLDRYRFSTFFKGFFGAILGSCDSHFTFLQKIAEAEGTAAPLACVRGAIRMLHTCTRVTHV